LVSRLLILAIMRDRVSESTMSANVVAPVAESWSKARRYGEDARYAE
jgi:hypothetical protein